MGWSPINQKKAVFYVMANLEDEGKTMYITAVALKSHSKIPSVKFTRVNKWNQIDPFGPVTQSEQM